MKNGAFKCMLTIIFLVLLTAGAYAAVSAWEGGKNSEAADRSPSIEVPETTYDFGEIWEGGEVVHDFIVKNKGNAELQINKVRPG